MMSREVHHVYFILSKPSYCPVFHSLMPNNVWVVTAIIYVLVLLKGLSWVGGWVGGVGLRKVRQLVFIQQQ